MVDTFGIISCRPSTKQRERPAVRRSSRCARVERILSTIFTLAPTFVSPADHAAAAAVIDTLVLFTVNPSPDEVPRGLIKCFFRTGELVNCCSVTHPSRANQAISRTFYLWSVPHCAVLIFHLFSTWLSSCFINFVTVKNTKTYQVMF